MQVQIRLQHFYYLAGEIRTEIPALENKLEDHEVRENDWESKQTMKKYFDEGNKVQESIFNEGDTVLLRQRKENKLSTRFENKKYRIVEKKGNSVSLCDDEDT